MKAYPLFTNSTYETAALIAKVSAGEPLEIVSEIEMVDLNYLLTRGNPDCLLVQVDGDSMSSEIVSGDYVMLDRTRRPKPNDIVIARLGGAYTIKRHKLNNGHRTGLYLVPANLIYEPKKVTEDDDFEILGVVTAVIHRTV